MKKNIYIIDSINTALIVSILIREEYNNFEVYLEKKIGIDDLNDYEDSLRFIYPEISNFIIKEVWVPSYYFFSWGKSIFEKIKIRRNFKKSIKEIFPFENQCTYIGPRTSSIILAANSRDCRYIDHGYGEYAGRAELIRGHQGLLSNLLGIYKGIKSSISLYLGMPSLKLSKKNYIYTLCQLEGDYATHIDFMKILLSDKFLTILRSIKLRYFSATSPTLFLAASERHSAQGMPSYRGDFDLVNCNLITKHCKKTDFIIIKFHGVLYYSDQNPKSRLVELLKINGFDSIIIDDHLPFSLRGQVPAELLIKVFEIKKVVSEVSATVFNIAHIDDIHSTCDLSLSPSFLDRNLLHWQMIKRVNSLVKNKISIFP